MDILTLPTHQPEGVDYSLGYSNLWLLGLVTIPWLLSWPIKSRRRLWPAARNKIKEKSLVVKEEDHDVAMVCMARSRCSRSTGRVTTHNLVLIDEPNSDGTFEGHVYSE